MMPLLGVSSNQKGGSGRADGLEVESAQPFIAPRSRNSLSLCNSFCGRTGTGFLSERPRFCGKVAAHGDGNRTSHDGKKERKLERFDIVLTVLLAGWAPSILMLLISYTTLKNTLNQKFCGTVKPLFKLVAHLVDDDLVSTASIISYYQTLPDMERLFTAPNPQDAAQQWIAAKFFSYPRIDGMFIASADGRLLGSLPAAPSLVGQPFHPEVWKDGADGGTNSCVSPVHHRPVDDRMVTDVVGAIRTRDGKTIGYIGASILIERIGRRLSSISFADKAHCQIVDQTGFRLFTQDFKAETEPTTPAEAKLISDIRKEQTGYLSQGGNIYSFDPLESTPWLAIIHQPRRLPMLRFTICCAKLPCRPAG